MSFLGNIWGGVKDAATGVVKGTVGKASDAIGDLLSGNSGSSTAATNHDTAVNTVKGGYISAAVKKYVALGFSTAVATTQANVDWITYSNSTAGKAAISKIEAELNKGSNVQGSTVGTILKGLLDSAVSGVKTGLEKGIGTSLGLNITNLINKGGTKVLGSGTVKTIQDQLAAAGADTLGKTITEFIKKYWFYLIVPFGLTALVVVKLLQSIFKGKSGGKSSKAKSYWSR